MTGLTVSTEYKCYNDCLPEGCPGHIATLRYYGSSDSLTFNNGINDSPQYFRFNEIKALFNLMNKIGTASRRKSGHGR